MSIEPPPDSPLGLVYELRGRLGVGRRQGIALGVDGDTVLVHFSEKDKDATRLPITTSPSDLTPVDASPATRLVVAADHAPKASWDKDLIRRCAGGLLQDVRAVRRTFDEALERDLDDVVGWAGLTSSEKAWRIAHHAAQRGDTARLVQALRELPATGYADRGALLRPFLGEIRHRPAVWEPVLQSFAAAGIAETGPLTAATSPDWRTAVDGALALLPDTEVDGWRRVVDRLAAEGSLDPPPVGAVAPAWSVASLVSGTGGMNEQLSELAGLEPEIVDDLVDAGRLDARADLGALPDPMRRYLQARLRPADLADDDLEAVRHWDELARRRCAARDRTALSRLDPTPGVRHYEALLDVLDGAAPDVQRLRPHAAALLELPAAALGQIADGSAKTLPPEIAADPSLWSLFAQHAVTGKLVPDPRRDLDDPLNVWIGTHRLMGLIWEGDFAGASELGAQLVHRAGSDAAVRDEALSLAAYAAARRGRPEEALALLDRALESGRDRESLLVNASVVASANRPEVAVRYLVRLVAEAPEPALQRAGLQRALDVVEQHGMDFPSDLVPALRTVLGSRAPIEEYLRFGTVAVESAPEIVPGLPDLGGDLGAPLRILRARAKLKNEAAYTVSDMAEEYAAVTKQVGRPAWFDAQWHFWVEVALDTMFVDFGDAMGTATFVDTVLMKGPELFDREERFLLAPQAGAHLAADFGKQDTWLTEAAWRKFFFAPIEEFLQVRHDLPQAKADRFASNFTLTLGVAGANMFAGCRSDVAEAYNAVITRLRWDHQNRYALESQARRILDEAMAGPVATLAQVVATMRRIGSTDERRRSLTRDLADDLDSWRAEIVRLRQDL